VILLEVNQHSNSFVSLCCFLQCGVEACGAGQERRCSGTDKQPARHHATESDHFAYEAGQLLGMDLQVENP
jgi:hypothetical protein